MEQLGENAFWKFIQTICKVKLHFAKVTFSLCCLLNSLGLLLLKRTHRFYNHRWGAQIDTIYSPLSSIRIQTHTKTTRSFQAVSLPSIILIQCCLTSVFSWEQCFQHCAAPGFQSSIFTNFRNQLGWNRAFLVNL